MLIVDYERSNFSVGPCVWTPGAKQNIITIASMADASNAMNSISTSISTSTSTPGAGKAATKSSISTGVIAAIVIIAVLVIILGCVLFWLRKKQKWPYAKTRAELDGSAQPMETSHIDGNGNTFEPSAYSDLNPKPNTFEAMSYPLSEMHDAQPIAGFYTKDGRHEMADTAPIGSELASPELYGRVHEMFDPSVYREMHSTTSSQARGSPSIRAATNVAQPFSWMETPISALSDSMLPGREATASHNNIYRPAGDRSYPSPSQSRSARNQGYNAKLKQTDEHSQETKRGHRNGR
jgi:hypothetical protein